MTWREWDDQASRVAGWLESVGVGEGSRVALIAHNCPELFVLVHASFKLRAVPAPLNYRYRATELAEVIADSGATVAFFDASLADEVAGARELTPLVDHWVSIDDGAQLPSWSLDLADVLASPPAARRVRSSDDLLLQYTGGTTGRPKGVMWDHLGILRLTSLASYMPLGLGLPETVEDMVAIAEDHVAAGKAPRYLVSVPLMHGTGFWGSCSQLQIGGTLILLDGHSFSAAEMLTVMAKHEISSIVLVGDAFAQPLVEELDRAAGAGAPYDLTALQGVTSSGVAFSAPYKRRLMAHAPNALIMEVIGGSESGALATALTMPGTDPPDTSVFIADPQTVLVDADRIVPWGTPGIYLLGFGGSLPNGYLGDPTKTAATFREIDGHRFLVSGDMGSIDADGTLHFIGRGNTVINTGGEKVFPAEVEEVVKLHPAVRDCLVVGVPDQRFGSVVAAVVALQPGESLDLDGLASHTRSMLAGYKVPRRLAIIDAIRRSAAGKSDYRWAAERFSAQ